jgi:PAS domain S-box-containing protein
MKRKAASAQPPKDLRGRAEEVLAKTDRDIERMPEQDVQKLVHDLQVHQIELEMQNDELRRTQRALEEARDRFSDLYDFAPLALLTLSAGGEVLEANLAAAGLFGLERKALIHQKFTHFIPAEAQDTFYRYCQQVLHLQSRQTGELALKSATGRRLIVRLEGIAAEDPITHKTNCRLSLSDITDRKEAERRHDLTGALSALFAQKRTVSEYLHSVVELFRQWSGSQALGIRLVNEQQEIPYEAWAGFEPGFIELENRLSLQRDTCCCIRAITQAAEGPDRALLTPGGSYHCDDVRAFAEQFPPQERERHHGTCVRFGFASVAIVPILCRDAILGGIHLADRRTGHFPPSLVEFIESLAPMVGEAVRRFQAEAELAKHRDHLEELTRQRTGELQHANEQLRKEIVQRKQAEGRTAALARLGLLLSAAHEPAVAARALVDTAREFCGWDACFLLMHDPVTDTITDLVNMDMIDGQRVPVQPMLAGRRPTPLIRRVMQEGPQLILRQSPEDRGPTTARFGDTSRASLSLMFVPVRLESKSIGVLSVQSYQRDAYTRQDLEVLQGLADHGTGALVRVQAETALRRLNEELERRTRELEAANEQLRKEIASRQVAEQALLRTAEDLKRSNLDLEQFAYVASHDLQEPLRAVAGYVRLLEYRFPEKVDAKTREYIAGAAEGATRMERLITDLLTFSRLSTEGRPFTPVNLDVPLNTALRNLQFSIRTAHASVTNDSLPTLPVDESQIVQLFQNLIGNALKFHSERPAQIYIGARLDEGRWVFGVRDNGIGMDSQYVERVFQVFQRLHTRKRYPGTGIGLAICKKIVERHGGKIWVESQPGQGSTFYFSFPPAVSR